MSNAIRYFKALSDETRLRLAYVLDRYELSVNELVSILEMGQSRVSRHLKILTEAARWTRTLTSPPAATLRNERYWRMDS